MQHSRLRLEEFQLRKQLYRWTNILFLIVIIYSSFSFLNINPLDILVAPIPMTRFLIDNFFPPSTNHLRTYLPAVIETIFFAVASTYIASFLSIFFAVLMSERLNPYRNVRFITRIFIAFLRNIPVLIWASLLIFVFGIGSMVGLMALVLSSIGFLSRSYAESIDDIEEEKLEAIKSSGASFLQIFYHGVLPEFSSSWLNWTLFLFELNIRISSILGIVGAGGIGNIIQWNLQMRRFNEASTLIIILVCIVLITEFTVGRIRRNMKL